MRPFRARSLTSERNGRSTSVFRRCRRAAQRPELAGGGRSNRNEFRTLSASFCRDWDAHVPEFTARNQPFRRLSFYTARYPYSSTFFNRRLIASTSARISGDQSSCLRPLLAQISLPRGVVGPVVLVQGAQRRIASLCFARRSADQPPLFITVCLEYFADGFFTSGLIVDLLRTGRDVGLSDILNWPRTTYFLKSDER